jgi:hypothetical protein
VAGTLLPFLRFTKYAEEVPPHVLNLGIKSMQVAGFTSGPPYPRKDPRYTFDRTQSVPQSHLYLHLLQFSNVIRVSFVRFSHKPCCPTLHLFDMMKRQVQFLITDKTNQIRDEVLPTTGTALRCRPVGHFLLLGISSETKRRLAS